MVWILLSRLQIKYKMTQQKTKPYIEGVIVKPLRKIPDERGAIFHMLRNDDPEFEKFGEIYFSMIYPGIVKGWHIHEKMVLNYAVVMGTIKLVLYDNREDSPTKGNFMEIIMGDQNYVLVKVPPKIWNGFKGVGHKPAIVANCASIPHDSLEIKRIPPDSKEILYDWSTKNG